MPYTAPTIADLKVRFPAFASVGDPLLTLVLNEAIGAIGPEWLERDRAPAQLYYAAHMLASEGAADGGISAVAGPVKRDKVGDVETEFASVTSGAVGDTAAFGSTEYGRRYLRLLRLNFPGVAVV